ncbi:hypothetical protein SAMN05216604_1072 [Pseudomonas agarici]|nr:hypothetical protein SAMN05216604_1072 [Pseudomonas agarici]
MGSIRSVGQRLIAKRWRRIGGSRRMGQSFPATRAGIRRGPTARQNEKPAKADCVKT